MTTTTATRDSKGRFTGSKRTSTTHNLGVIAGAAAGGMALGMLALLGRKAVVQAPSLLAGNWDEALATEHEAVRKVFGQIEATDEHSSTRRNLLLAHLKHALMKHAVEEENVIYPALREAGQRDAADQLTKEHGYVKQHLYELENMPTASPDWISSAAAAVRSCGRGCTGTRTRRCRPRISCRCRRSTWSGLSPHE